MDADGDIDADAPVPDTFIYLYKAGSSTGVRTPVPGGGVYQSLCRRPPPLFQEVDYNAGGGTPISFARIPTRSILKSSGAPPYWQSLREDSELDDSVALPRAQPAPPCPSAAATNALLDSEYAGSLLLQLALLPNPRLRAGGFTPAVVAHRQTWEAYTAALQQQRLRPFELRVHVYQVRRGGAECGSTGCYGSGTPRFPQGRELPAADLNGSIDPFVKASIGGGVKATTARYTTAAPVWYETLCLPVTLPVSASGEPLLHLAPQLHVELWDENVVLSNAFGAWGEVRE